MSPELVDGRFRITGAIGSGNMGEVSRAEDLQAPADSPARIVAVKTILRHRSGSLIDTAADAPEDADAEISVLDEIAEAGGPDLR